MAKQHGWKHCLWMAPLTIAAAFPTLTAAQAPSANEPSALEEIIVTARKREENLIDVPISVTAVSADQIARRGIQDVEGIIQGDPSLGFDLGIAPYDTRIVVRGLSPTRGRPNVATLVDGIDVSSEAVGVAGGSLLINPRLVDIARIEVVKGPQSALYGRSAFAGAIQYITADPSAEFGGEFSLDANDNDGYELKGSFSLPFNDTLGFRLNGYRFEEPGFYDNSFTGAPVGGASGKGGSLVAKWTPNETYDLKVRTEYSDDQFDVPAQGAVPFNTVQRVPDAASSCNVYGTGGLFAAGPVLDASCATLTIPGGATFANPVRIVELASGSTGFFDDASVPAYRGTLPRGRDVRVAYNPDWGRIGPNGVAPEFSGTNRQVLRLSAVQNLEFPFGRFTSLTGYTRAETATDQDFDKTATLSTQQTLRTDNLTEQFSQELRFTSDFDGPLQFITGLQYWTERADQVDLNNTVFGRGVSCVLLSIAGMFTCAPGSGLTSTDISQYMDDVLAARRPFLTRRTVEHRSFYLEFEWNILESLKLIGEARYVDEDNGIQARQTVGNQGPGTVILCGATGNCGVAANIPYAPQPGLPRTFAGTTQLAPIIPYDRSESYVTPKATLQWQPSDSLNIYGSYSEGRKPGGFATLTTGAFGLPPRADVEFESEKITVYELGTKWASPSRTLNVQAAYFFQDFTDKQVSTQVILGTTLGNRVTNAGGAQLQGLELSAQWRATDRLTLSGGLTHFFEYEYTNYETLTSGPAELARIGNCVPVVTTVVVSGMNVAQTTCRTSRTGRHLEDTPETAVALNVAYRAPLASGRSFFAELDSSWVDERFAEDDNTILLEDYSLTNLRIGLEGERWTALVYVDNVFDDDKIKSGGTGPGNVFADLRSVAGPGSGALAATLPANFRNPVGAFSIAIPTGVFANLPPPRVIGFRFNYKFQ